jgi:RecA-family ATPase
MADAFNTINVILKQGAEQEANPTRLVQDLITENSIGLLAGESQAGKSFLAVDLTFALALGQRFFGKEARRSPVYRRQGASPCAHEMA